MKTKSLIDVSQKNDIAIVKLNRPEKRNAINDEMRNAIIDMLLELNIEDTVKAVVITGAGTVFCAGGDMAMLKSSAARLQTAMPGDREWSECFTMYRRFASLVEAMLMLPQAVVVVCEGVSVGGGLAFACVSDVTIFPSKLSFSLRKTPKISRLNT